MCAEIASFLPRLSTLSRFARPDFHSSHCTCSPGSYAFLGSLLSLQSGHLRIMQAFLLTSQQIPAIASLVFGESMIRDWCNFLRLKDAFPSTLHMHVSRSLCEWCTTQNGRCRQNCEYESVILGYSVANFACKFLSESVRRCFCFFTLLRVIVSFFPGSHDCCRPFPGMLLPPSLLSTAQLLDHSFGLVT